MLNVLITDWALRSYLDIVHAGLLPRDEYLSVVRPDVERLKAFPTDPKFALAGFWGPAKVGSHVVVDGFKMKWHNLAHLAQLRLCVAVVGGSAFVCHAYDKTSAALDRRQCLNLERRIKASRAGNVRVRGRLP